MVTSSKINSTAICEQIDTVSDFRIENYAGHLTPYEIEQLDICLLRSLALKAKDNYCLFDPGDDEILKSLYEHIKKLITTAKKISNLNNAINKLEDDCVVQIPNVQNLNNLLDDEELITIKRCAEDKLKDKRNKYYRELKDLNTTTKQVKDDECASTSVLTKSNSKKATEKSKKKKHNRFPLTKEELKQLYIVEGLSMKQIANKYSVGFSTVGRYLALWDLKKR